MKHQKGFTAIELIFVFVFVFGLVSWVLNATKLASCDFEYNYTCEVIHGVGLVVPPLAVVAVWFADDDA